MVLWNWHVFYQTKRKLAGALTTINKTCRPIFQCYIYMLLKFLKLILKIGANITTVSCKCYSFCYSFHLFCAFLTVLVGILSLLFFFCQLVSSYWNSESAFAIVVIWFCGCVAYTNVNTIVQLVVLVCSSGVVSFKASVCLPCYLALA